MSLVVGSVNNRVDLLALRLNHILEPSPQVTDTYYKNPVFSGLLLQNTLNRNHLFRAQLPNDLKKTTSFASSYMTVQF